MITVKENLEKAATLLELGGWTQEELYSRVGGRCLIAALTDIPDHNHNVVSVVDDALVDLVDWNNAPGRSADEVIGKLRELAELQP